MRSEGGRREWDIGITEAYRAVYTSAYKQMLPTQREQTKYVSFFAFFFFYWFPCHRRTSEKDEVSCDDIQLSYFLIVSLHSAFLSSRRNRAPGTHKGWTEVIVATKDKKEWILGRTSARPLSILPSTFRDTDSNDYVISVIKPPCTSYPIV